MKEDLRQEIKRLEKETLSPDFWKDKERAQEIIKRIGELKEKLKAGSKYDKGDAVVTIFAGAGGDDAEDWATILFEMYRKFAEKKGWQVRVLHHHKNEVGGTKNVTFEVCGRNAYGYLKGEAGVHRLVRISPFSARKLRHTSFALVDILPKFIEISEVDIKNEDIRVDFSRASGPGGQNVNKRETAVRITHIPTGLVAYVESERSQNQNKQRALELLRSKLYKYQQAKQEKERQALRGGKLPQAEWGHQIRSYVFHPYQMVKDHRTGVETSDVEGVLEGELDEFVEAERNLET